MSIIQRYDPDPTASYDIDMIPTPDGPFVSYTDHAAALAEVAEDYANLASTTNDLLRIAQARAEAAEAVVELARRWLHCADVINETFGSHDPIKDTETLSRRNVEYMDATDAMCAAIRQTKGTTQ